MYDFAAICKSQTSETAQTTTIHPTHVSGTLSLPEALPIPCAASICSSPASITFFYQVAVNTKEKKEVEVCFEA